MGKNKSKGGGKRKDMSVFKVAGSKVTKGKPKPVTTNLKRVSCLFFPCKLFIVHFKSLFTVEPA